MGINLKGIEIETKIKGIRIKVEADDSMREKWKFFLSGSALRNTDFIDIPNGLFIESEENPDERILFFDNKKQTSEIISNLILYNEELLKRENRKTWMMFFKYLSEPGKVYAKTVEKVNENGEYVLKTVYLSGDETTGLLFNL